MKKYSNKDEGNPKTQWIFSLCSKVNEKTNVSISQVNLLDNLIEKIITVGATALSKRAECNRNLVIVLITFWKQLIRKLTIKGSPY